MTKSMDPEQLALEYLSGKRVKEMANERGVSVQAIYYWLKTQGITRTKEQLYTYGCKTSGCSGKHHAHGYCNGCLSMQNYRKNKSAIEQQRKACGYQKEKRYEKTPKGFLVRTYRNMKSRVLGIQKLKAHLYIDKEILPKEDFYKWADAADEFKTLFDAWKKYGHDRKLTPSIDRIDPGRGYTEDNIRWLTHSENSRLGNYSRFRCSHRKPSR